MNRAESLAREHGVRLTAARQRALEILLERHVALGAYDILRRFEAEGLGSRPIIAYRALEFLREHGLVHRIEVLNAFVACTHPQDEHRPAFIVCRSCRTVNEAHVGLRNSPLEATAGAEGFRVEKTIAEVIGLCRDCQKAEEYVSG